MLVESDGLQDGLPFEIETVDVNEVLDVAEAQKRRAGVSAQIRILLYGLEIFSYDYRILTELARAYYASNEFLASKNCLDSILKFQPDSMNAHYYLMMIAMKHENYDEFERYAVALLAIGLRDEKVLQTATLLAKHYFIRNQSDKAFKVCDRALNDSPNDFVILSMVAKWKFRFGRHQEAKVYVDRALAVNPEDAEMFALKKQIDQSLRRA